MPTISINEIMSAAVKSHASDIFIAAGLPVSFKIKDELVPQDGDKLTPEESEEIVRGIYQLANRNMDEFCEHGDDDFSVSFQKDARFRVCAYRQRGSLAVVIRIIAFGIPDYKAHHIPENVMDVAKLRNGMVLVTGTAGSGKSTTLACIIDRINSTRRGHIVTLEDPIEYFHRNNLCAVSQREIGIDTDDYRRALRASLRQAPDVILLGEMRDFETIKTGLSAAETGHLVLATLHTISAAATVDRIIDVFPPEQQQQVRVQLPQILKTIISQQLVPTKDGRLIPAFEILNINSAIKTLIREDNTHQITSYMTTDAGSGMMAMDMSLMSLYESNRITEETAIACSNNVDFVKRRLSEIRQRNIPRRGMFGK